MKLRLLIQRVKEAQVVIEGRTHASIGHGLLVFLGIHKDDQVSECSRLTEKLVNLRIFTDPAGKMNLSVKDIEGSILVVSQFTLYADCSKGNRPSFTDAAVPASAESLYEKFLNDLRSRWPHISSGVFGASMQVHLINDGPVTMII